MSGEEGTSNSRARDGGDIKAWMKARNDHVRRLRQNATRSGRPTSRSGSSAPRRDDPRVSAGNLANAAGLAAGAVRGAAHLAEGIAAGGKMAGDIMFPIRSMLHPDSPAVLPLYGAAAEALHAGKEIALHPAEAFHRANLALNPAASPVAPTVEGEVRRRFAIGQNQGELGFDVVTGVGAPETFATGALPVEEQVARWTSKGLTERQARYMAEPYKGMGSHYYPRGAKLPSEIAGVALPKWLAGRPMPLPKALSDSPFNVLKPPGISRGDMYEKHVAVDSHFGGGRFAARGGGGTWSKTKLGLETYGLLGRLIHGAPPALARTVRGAASAVAGVVTAEQRQARR